MFIRWVPPPIKPRCNPITLEEYHWLRHWSIFNKIMSFNTPTYWMELSVMPSFIACGYWNIDATLKSYVAIVVVSLSVVTL
jgi:hypothetical protein